MSRLGDWLEERIGHRAALQRLLEHPLAGGPSWAHALGTTVVFLLVFEMVTGIALMTVYDPSPENAWASTFYVSNVMPFGWQLRGLHHYAGEAMIVLCMVHTSAIALRGAFRMPRELTLVSSTTSVALATLLCITGGLLPFDQKGYWARKVEIGIAAMGPGGSAIARLAQGGEELGRLALTRFYALHIVVLPLLMWFVLRMGRRTENKFAASVADRQSVGGEPYYPRQLARDLALAGVACIVAGYFTMRFHGAPLDAPADPASEYPARPEWYLMWLFELRHRLPSSLEFWGTTFAPVVIGALIAGLPWTDRRKGRGGPVAIGVMFFAWMTLAILSASAVRRDASDPEYQSQRKQADDRAASAITVARDGVPPDGALAMMRRDPEMRGQATFAKQCASCHMFGDLGTIKDAKAPKLDGWSTEKWIAAMLRDPDNDDRFGRSAYRTEMPSQTIAPKEHAENFRPLSDDEVAAVASFLFAEGVEPDDPEVTISADVRARGGKIVKDRCTGCHLWNGEGDDGGQGLAPELRRYGSMSWVMSQVRDPSSRMTYRENALDPVRKGHMPKFDDELSDTDIFLVARWVRAKARGLPMRGPVVPRGRRWVAPSATVSVPVTPPTLTVVPSTPLPPTVSAPPPTVSAPPRPQPTASQDPFGFY